MSVTIVTRCRPRVKHAHIFIQLNNDRKNAPRGELCSYNRYHDRQNQGSGKQTVGMAARRTGELNYPIAEAAYVPGSWPDQHGNIPRTPAPLYTVFSPCISAAMYTAIIQCCPNLCLAT
jgi:hypothetical protein